MADVRWIKRPAEDPYPHYRSGGFFGAPGNCAAGFGTVGPVGFTPTESFGATPGQSAITAASPAYAVRSVAQVSVAYCTYFSSGRRYTTTIYISASCATRVLG